MRIRDYAFTPDSRFLYYVHVVGSAPSGSVFARRVSVPSPGFPETLISGPTSADVMLGQSFGHVVLKTFYAGAYNQLFSVRAGTTRLLKWVDDTAENQSEIIQPVLEPDGCGMFYVRRTNGFVAPGVTTGEQAWHARCAVQAFLPNAVVRWIQGGFMLDFQPHLGLDYRLSFSDTLGIPEVGGGGGSSDWIPVQSFSASQLPWFDNGQHTGGAPEKGHRFYRIEIEPFPYSVEKLQN